MELDKDMVCYEWRAATKESCRYQWVYKASHGSAALDGTVRKVAQDSQF